jgi:catechol-2,3-dioxygenase
MAMQLGHVHIKTREDPQTVAKFYIDNFGATVKREKFPAAAASSTCTGFSST